MRHQHLRQGRPVWPRRCRGQGCSPEPPRPLGGSARCQVPPGTPGDEQKQLHLNNVPVPGPRHGSGWKRPEWVLWCQGSGRVIPEHTAEDYVQMVPEYLQRGRLHSSGDSPGSLYNLSQCPVTNGTSSSPCSGRISWASVPAHCLLSHS